MFPGPRDVSFPVRDVRQERFWKVKISAPLPLQGTVTFPEEIPSPETI